MKRLVYGRGICYSGYRVGQSPRNNVYPTYKEIFEDLKILESNFEYIRMYDPSIHAKTTLEVIKKENIDLKVLIGIDLLGEVSNPNCAWGGLLSKEEIQKNIEYNENQLKELIQLSRKYEDIIIAVSAGNEAVPEWNENLVLPERIFYFVKKLKANCKQAVTYCENNNYWISHLDKVANEVDFISVHTYPAWIQVPIDKAFHKSIKEFYTIQNHYKDIQCIITEAGWPTNSNGRGIPVEIANETNQKKYIKEMQNWSEKNKITVFFFEAFDEPWKGSNVSNEPEKHWGYYFVDRKPKKIMQD